MSARLPLFAALCVVLAACAHPGDTAGEPPTISYRVTGGDLGFAYASAAQWCRPYGTTPVLRSLGSYDPMVQPGATTQRTVVYGCNGPPDVATAGLHGNTTSGVGSSMPPSAPAP